MSNTLEIAPRYNIGRDDAVYLLALMNNPDAIKMTRSEEDLKGLLVNVLKLAETISENCREWLELAGIVHGDMHPYQAEKLNIPTLIGALSSAITVPRVDTSDCCHSCAFRVGSSANMTEAVASDVMDCMTDGTVFYCHHKVDENFETKPKHSCRGFVAAMKHHNPKPNNK